MIGPHVQKVTHRYQLRYEAHEPRQGDPHYQAFNAYHRANQGKGVCYVGARVGFDECADAHGGPLLTQPGASLELHHKILEFAVLNEVDVKALEVDFPNLTDPEKVKVWAETDANFMWLCAKHHRGDGGAHDAAYADFEASLYVRGLIL
jgi:hypothetical protein